MSNLSRKLMMGAAGAAGEKVYVEDVFSTYLYTGNGSTQTITNDIDLAGEGGLVWAKPRSIVANNTLYDTARGVSKALISNSAVPEQDYSGNGVTSFNSNGFAVTDSGPYAINDTGTTYVSWAFREQPKFFDIVTYTGNQAVGHNISHNLGSAPGLIIVKAYEGDSRNWFIYHRSLGATKHLVFTTAAATVQTDIWNDTEPTSTQFTVGDSSNVNQNGRLYIAYLFAHNAGGFGDAGTDNVISCGSFTDSSSGWSVDLGFEPQFLLTKRTDGSGNWEIVDTMRGFTVDRSYTRLYPNLNNAEQTVTKVGVNSTGFFSTTAMEVDGATIIYIAIRRGPMRAPESGTEVFAMDNPQSLQTDPGFISGFPVDLGIFKLKSSVTSWYWTNRVAGEGRYLESDNTTAEQVTSSAAMDYNNGWWDGVNNTGAMSWMFRRAPGFFDVVCYAGTDIAHTEAHSLGVAPEMIIVKNRTGSSNWSVLHNSMNTTGGDYIRLDLTTAKDQNVAIWNSTLPTNAVFTVGTSDQVNHTYQGAVYVAYLFATLAGVSKVGGYTGTGTTLSIDCGFTAGARFVLIKRTDSTGDWYVWDTTRGIIAGNDPYLLFNSAAAEVTNTDYIDPLSSGFQISSTAPAAINASGGTYIFLAIA